MYDSIPKPLLPTPPIVHHVDEDQVRLERINGVLFIHVNGEQVFPPAPEHVISKDVPELILLSGMSYSADEPIQNPLPDLLTAKKTTPIT